jgi:hypothetical protein
MLADDFNLDGRRTHVDHLEFSRCRVGQVQHAPNHVRSPIGDPDAYRLSILQIEDTDNAPEGELAVRGRIRRHVKGFSICRELSIELLPVPGSDSAIFDPDIQRKFPFGQGRTGTQ